MGQKRNHRLYNHCQHGVSRILLLMIFLALSLPTATQGQNAADYFEDNCAACHSLGGGDGIGPDLVDFAERKPIEWFIAFTRNPDSAIESGDPYVVDLYQQYDEMLMPGYPDLTQEMGRALYTFIQNQSEAPTEPPAEPQTDTTTSPAAMYFEDNCAACHTVGGGAGIGPDLRNVNWRKDFEWLYAFTTNPDSVIEAGDPHANRMIEIFNGNVMPSFPDLDRDFARDLYAYIEDQSQFDTRATTVQLAEESEAEVDPAAGEALFVGKEKFDSGAPSCIGCHRGRMPAVGGNLGPDLGHVFDRLGGRRVLSAWLASPPTPVMQSIYRSQPLTETEAQLLIDAFERWQETKEDPASQSSAVATAAVVGGLGGLVSILVLIGVTWSNRYRGVRRKLVSNATRRK